MSSDRVVLLSVRPRFVDAILAGTKSIELRRTRIHALPGTLVMLYSSSPSRSVQGTAVIERIESGSPEVIWDHSRGRVGVSRQEFTEYFDGASAAFALHLRDIAPLQHPFPLQLMRSRTGLEPPQSFRYITDDQAKQLMHA